MAVMKGYKQTPEHIQKRIASMSVTRSKDPVSVRGGRARALRKYPPQPCEACGKARADRHHKDGDTGNNESLNIAYLCRRCHMEADGRLEALRQMARERAPQLVEAGAAAQRAKTHCPQGHPYSGANLYVTPNGRRTCRECRRESGRRYNAKERAR